MRGEIQKLGGTGVAMAFAAAGVVGLAAGAAWAAPTVVASDDFDAPLNLVSYVAVDGEGNDPSNTGVWSSPRDNFGVRTMRDRLDGSPTGNFLSETLVDASTAENVFDTLGILTPDYPGNFFAVCDTDNGANETGVAEGSWTFDISQAGVVTEFRVDMAAVGNWFDDGLGSFERFTWAYSVDGGPETALFTVRADETIGAVTYSLANGTTFSVPGNTVAGADDNGVSVNGVPLLNALTTLTAPLSGSGSRLTLTFNGYVNDNNAGLVFDNIVIMGDDAACAADFNGDTTPGDIFDLFDFLSALDGGLDFNGDTSPADIFDLFDFLSVLDLGCP